jgi:hypothetical protein
VKREPPARIQARAPKDRQTPPPPARSRAPWYAPLSPADDEAVRLPGAAAFPASEREPTLPLTLTAFILAGLSLAISQVPYGPIASAGLAGLGLVLGLRSVLAAERRLLPLSAAGLNGAILLVLALLPGWLGLRSWWPAKTPDDSPTVQAVAHDGTWAPAEWVDASQASWRLGDVQLAVSAVTVGPVQLVSPNGQQGWTQESYLQIRLFFSHEGVARTIDFQGWSRVAPADAAPHLTDSAGKVLAAKTLDPGWEPVGVRRATTLFPGKTAEDLLLFEVPAQGVTYLRLELPGAAFGSSETVRLQIPLSMAGPRPRP